MNSITDIILSQGAQCFDYDKEWLGVTTPHFFSNGRPSTYYIRTNNGRVWIRDVGLNFRIFADNLPNPEKARDILKRQINQVSDMIYFSGNELSVEASIQEIKPAISAMLSILARMTSYAPASEFEQSFDEVVAKIKDYLIFKYGNIKSDVDIQGASGTKHHFAFQSGTRLIDVCTPSAKTTGHLLRKGFDVHGVTDEAEFQVFLDDRESPKSYKNEANILSSLYAVTPVSKIIQLAS